MSDIVERLEDMQERLVLSSDDDIIIFEAVSEIIRLRAENEKLRAALIDTLASLVASIDLLERGGKKAAPSNKMFEQMLVDYKNSIERGRAAAAALKETGDE